MNQNNIINLINSHHDRLLKKVEVQSSLDILDKVFPLDYECGKFIRNFISNSFDLDGFVFCKENYKTKEWAITYKEMQSFIMKILKEIIIEFYGSACSTDKASFLYSSFFSEHFLKQNISFDKKDYEYSFHIPETCSKEAWINLVLSIFHLSNGNYMMFGTAIKNLKKEHHKEIYSYNYMYNELTERIDYILNKWTFAKDVFENSIDERFPNRDFLLEERNHNHLVLKKLLNMLVNKDEIFNIYLYFKENFKKSKKLYKNKKKQTMLEYWTLEEKHQNGEIYLYYFEPFYKYRGLYSEANNIIKKLERLSKM